MGQFSGWKMIAIVAWSGGLDGQVSLFTSERAQPTKVD
jgi:hypothetical protein